ncbi:MAG: TolC family protein [Planctomycetes bacterium]|nr:TolC family protein [Planctomycetota bacterium]MBL7042550.1 TolC family protein [Pirellulaceae bacterium]
MFDKFLRVIKLLLIASVSAAGCATQDPNVAFHDDLRHYEDLLAATEYGDTETPPQIVNDSTPPPLAMRSNGEPGYWSMPLNQAIRTALANSDVLNDLGGTIVQTPENVRTIKDPSIQETDPRFGVAAALSAFDAELLLNGNFEKNDRALNNRFLAGTHVLRQDLHDYATAIRKKTATGSEFTLRHTMDYDANNANGNLFGSAWDTAFEAEFRHPLLQGGGIDFNRIAGPNSAPGAINGVVIARINTDMSLTDLEVGLRDFVSNVENAYWDLYYAYRDLDAKRRARDASLKMWRDLSAKRGLPGAEDDKIAQAREQYYRFEVEVQNALSGRPVEGTRASNDTSGGTFRANGGVYVAERRLRLLLGLPLNGDRLIRPGQEPSLAKAVFEWDGIVGEAMTRRAELRRQRLGVRRRELELLAHKNFLRPRLDAVGLYRWRGFGKDLLDPTSGFRDASGFRVHDDAFGSLTSGEFQEWQLGFEFSLPIGFRQAHSAVRNSQLALARERSILREQERQIIHDLSNAITEMERAYHVAQVNLNRRNAALHRRDVLEQKADEGNVTFVNLTLDAQQRLASAESDFFRSLVEYALAVKNVHVEKGTWKSYHSIMLTEDITAGRLGHGRVMPEPPAEPQPSPDIQPQPLGPTEAEPDAVESTRAAPQASEAPQSGGPGMPPIYVEASLSDQLRSPSPPAVTPVEVHLTSPPARSDDPAPMPSSEAMRDRSPELEQGELPADLFDSAVESSLAG